MPTWGQILVELQDPANRDELGNPSLDKLRRSYLARLAALSGRPVILYASAFLDQPELSSGTTIELGDLQGFMNAVAKLHGRELDLIITSQGGSAEATDSIVSYLRTRFDHIRAFIPVAAMSAATMMALGADEIVLGCHSQLGPIDPQFTISTPEGLRSAPAAEILEQFERAKAECADPTKLAAWVPILRTYSPGLLAQCVTSRQLAEAMVEQWLRRYMLRNDSDGPAKAKAAATWFGDYKNFGSHGRRVGYDDLVGLGLTVSRLEEDDQLQDAVLSVHHACSHTFSNTAAGKIIENHLGDAFIRMFNRGIRVNAPTQILPPPSPTTPIVPAPGASRAERRRNDRGR